ncbi:MAG: thiamine pyrophosphate-dependent dehydrogenase E1 component subunit alpha [Acidobacteria bacterium]|nr:thiamine pyrophosphate-dependent dehydrogenase E1 component subunit alpha [Acidobacteriota bacterium]
MNPVPEIARDMYHKMRLIRRFEERVVQLVNANEIAGTTHEYVGEEAVAVGICSALRGGDVITSTHRGHGHILAKGGEPRRMMAELFGRVTGYNRGKGGSMHIADLGLGIYGANGMVAGGVPIAAGAAFASRIRKSGVVAVAFFGDGGANQGVLHETMNLAGVWQLPMLFVCENNGYAVSTASSASTSGPGIAARAAGYGFPGEVVDGMDVQAVYDAAVRACDLARSGQGPSLLECRCYRFHGHFTAEKALQLKYRTNEEIDFWKARDPIPAWAARLEGDGILPSAEREQMDEAVEALLDEAVEFARSSPWPGPEEALEHMYAVRYPGLPSGGTLWNVK